MWPTSSFTHSAHPPDGRMPISQILYAPRARAFTARQVMCGLIAANCYNLTSGRDCSSVRRRTSCRTFHFPGGEHCKLMFTYTFTYIMIVAQPHTRKVHIVVAEPRDDLPAFLPSHPSYPTGGYPKRGYSPGDYNIEGTPIKGRLTESYL